MLREYWYPALPSARLARKPVAARVFDRQLVLFRDAEGAPRALLDRCAHRGAELSRGRCVDGAVVCPYHGWVFDGTGTCTLVPSLLKGQHLSASVPVFACEEGDAYIWVWMGAGDPGKRPRPTLSGVRRGIWLQGSRELGASATRGLENAFDVAHVPFVHARTHPYAKAVGRSGLSEKAAEVRVLATGLVMFAPPTASADAPVPETGLRAELVLPSTVVVRTGARGIGSQVIQSFVPTGPGRSRLEWMVKLAGFGRRILQGRGDARIAREDREVMESAQAGADLLDEEFEHSVEADAATLLVRQVLAAAARPDAGEALARLPRRRVFRFNG